MVTSLMNLTRYIKRMLSCLSIKHYLSFEPIENIFNFLAFVFISIKAKMYKVSPFCDFDRKINDKKSKECN